MNPDPRSLRERIVGDLPVWMELSGGGQSYEDIWFEREFLEKAASGRLPAASHNWAFQEAPQCIRCGRPAVEGFKRCRKHLTKSEREAATSDSPS